MRWFLNVALLALLVGACQSAPGGGSATPSRVADGVAGLIADLRSTGASVSEAGTFAPEPLAGRGVLLCVNAEPVRVYEYESTAERSQAASRINPKDPSNLGTSIVEWAGSPRFWQRDRVLVLYLGQSAATEALLSSLLGLPFAKGAGLPPLAPDTCP